jgi:SAM-dependent methyltransferase
MLNIKQQFLNKWHKYLESEKWNKHGGDGFKTWGHGNFPFVASLVPDSAKKVLEIGCADGYLSHLLIQKGHDVIGLTYAENEQRNCIKNGVNAILSDMHDLPFLDDTFDAIVSRQTLEHALSPLVVLFECNRVLKHNGYLIIHIPYSLDGTDYSLDYHHSPFTPIQWRFYLYKSGFREILKEDRDIEQNSYYFIVRKTEVLTWEIS